MTFAGRAGTSSSARRSLVRIHKAPDDYWRFTDDGLRLILERAGFEVSAVKMWGNRAVVRASLWRWPAQRRWRSLKNVEDSPVVVWAFARRADDHS